MAFGAAWGCAIEREVPKRLVDGSRPPPLPKVLGELDDAVMTRVVRRLNGRSEELAGCATDVGIRASSEYVQRVGVLGRTVTLSVDATRLLGCDAAARAAEPRGRWCAHAFGRLRAGRLTDARVTLANCQDADRNRVAFAWLEPPPGARWLVVEHDAYREIYEVAGGLPIRIATRDGIDVARSSVTVRFTSYAPDGRKLAAREVRIRVAS